MRFFSTHNSMNSEEDKTVKHGEKVVRATLYVERGEYIASPVPLTPTDKYRRRARATFRRGYYVVLETECGSSIATEFRDGKMTWEENLKGLEVRNSLSKVLCWADCRQANITAQDIKLHQKEESQRLGCRALPSKRRLYALNAYNKAIGADGEQMVGRVNKDFLKPGKEAKLPARKETRRKSWMYASS